MIAGPRVSGVGHYEIESPHPLEITALPLSLITNCSAHQAHNIIETASINVMTLENSNETSPLSLIMNESRKLWLSTKCRGFLVRSNLHVKKTKQFCNIHGICSTVYKD